MNKLRNHPALLALARLTAIVTALVVTALGLTTIPASAAVMGGTPFDTVSATADQVHGMHATASRHALSFSILPRAVDGTKIVVNVAGKWLVAIDAGTQANEPLPLVESGYAAPKPSPNPYAYGPLFVQGPRLIEVLVLDVLRNGRHSIQTALPGTTLPKGDTVKVIARDYTGIFGLRFYSHLGPHLNGQAYMWVESGGIVRWYALVWGPQRQINSLIKGMIPIPAQPRAP